MSVEKKTSMWIDTERLKHSVIVPDAVLQGNIVCFFLTHGHLILKRFVLQSQIKSTLHTECSGEFHRFSLNNVNIEQRKGKL